MNIFSNYCNNSSFVQALFIIKIVLQLVFIIVPIIIIIASFISIFNVIVSGNKEDMSKFIFLFIRRIIAGLIIFFIPLMLSYSFSLIEKYDDSAIKVCFENVSKERIIELRELELLKLEEKGKKESNDLKKLSQQQAEKEKKKKELLERNPKAQEVIKIEADDDLIVDTIDEPPIITNNVFRLEKKKIALTDYDKYRTDTIKILDSSGGNVDYSKYEFKSDKPGIASVSNDGVITAHFGGITSIKVSLKEDPSKIASCNVMVIRSLYTKARTSRTMTGTSLVTGKSVTLGAGTKGDFNGVGKKIKQPYPLGNVFHTNDDYISVNPSDLTPFAYSISPVYSKEYVELFVNTYGFKSDTNYLFWTSHGAQMEYWFEGGEGKWKLIKEYEISTGDALGFENSDGGGSTGIHFSSYKIGWLRKESYSVPVLWKDNGRNGSNPWHIGGGQRYPKSHGCTRFNTDDLKEIESYHSQIVGSRIIDF